MTLFQSSSNDESNPSQAPWVKTTKLLPISSILLNEPTTLNHEKLAFCYHAVIHALTAFLECDYTKFDPLTTTNCCHGMALLVRQLIIESSELDVKEMINLVEKKSFQLQNHPQKNIEITTPVFNFFLPEAIINITQLYILSQIKEVDLERGGWRTNFHKIKELSPISAKFCSRITKDLQTHFSNIVAEKYKKYATEFDSENLIHGIPIKLWGKYLQSEYIKIDKRGRKYAPCLFSMQITLAHLIEKKIKIAMVNDLKCTNGILKYRFLHCMQGDGNSKFLPIHFSKTSHYNDMNEPIIIFGGCVYSDSLDENTLQFKMFPWLDNFQSLVLACDIHYPQYPSVSDDPAFENQPIIPDEISFKTLLDDHRTIGGVCIQNPSLFCLSHIYVASFRNVSQAIHEKDSTALPYSFIPGNKLNPT